MARRNAMNWKSLCLSMFFAVSALFLLPPSVNIAQADAIEKLRCNSSRCEFKEQLGKSVTKEFRAVCSNGVNPYPENMSIRQENKNTTCTTKCRGQAGDSHYITKSCTNWDPLSRDKLKIVVWCGDYPDTSGGIEDTCSQLIAK
jgi:hypothetical protein